jgi:hypothetical protein
MITQVLCLLVLALRGERRVHSIIWCVVCLLRAVYVATSIERNVYACNRSADGRLRPCDRWHVNTAVDNLVLRSNPAQPKQHVVYTGAHPKMLSFVAHEHNRRTPAPVQVLQLSGTAPIAGNLEATFDSKELLLSLGERFNFSASSVGQSTHPLPRLRL